MTKDEVIALAEKCKLAVLIHSQWTHQIKEFTVVDYVVEGDLGSLMQFADLVANAEREACAKIVENEAYQYTSPVWAFEIVNDIRARKQA
jgi:hypothetical protein